MNTEKKTLLFLYINDYCGFTNESFNFDIKRRFQVNCEKNTIYSCPEAIKDFPDNFFGEKISALTLLIGNNGAGKTTLIRLIVKWLCELASGIYPQERGALVVRVGEHNKLIGFTEGKSLEFEIAEGTDLEPAELEEIQSTLKDISLVYYTDTKSDLELEDVLTEDQLKYLTDYSYITRTSEALNHSDYLGNAKDTMNHEQFMFQMELFLKLDHKNEDYKNNFHIHFIKFRSVEIGTSKCLDRLKSLGYDGINIISIMENYGKAFAPKDNGPRMLARCLLWGLLTGVVSSILLWEAQLFSNQHSRFVSFFREAFSRYVDLSYTKIRDLFKNISGFVSSCHEGFFENKFKELWKQKFQGIMSYVDFLGETEKRYVSQGSTFNWQSRSISGKVIYYIDLDMLSLEQWKKFWPLYKELYYMMPDCSFDWQYASSGEKSLTNLMIPLYRTIEHDPQEEINHLWLLLDEPDNTLHPQQQREIIKNLCDVYDEEHNQYDNCQLLISTHSPIMLSDVPKQAAIFISGDYNKKKQKYPAKSTFAQQIYTLFDDAFFMQEGIIGAFAEKKINDVYKGLLDLETALINHEEYDPCEAQNKLHEAISIINCLEEPLLKGLIQSSYKRCQSEVNNAQKLPQ